MSKDTFQCASCDDGTVSMAYGPGRTFPYGPGILLPVPADFGIATCAACGEQYLKDAEEEALEALLECPNTST